MPDYVADTVWAALSSLGLTEPSSYSPLMRAICKRKGSFPQSLLGLSSKVRLDPRSNCHPDQNMLEPSYFSLCYSFLKLTSVSLFPSLSIARIRKHRRNTRKPGDASRLVGWPSYPRKRQRIAANGQEQNKTGVLPSFQQPPHFQLFFFNSRQCARIA